MALDWLHSATEPIVHRDVKPSNLMLCGNNYHHVKLVDFGLARQVPCNVEDQPPREAAHRRGDEEEASAWTNCGGGGGTGDAVEETRWEMTGMTGTYRYMAPEVWEQKVCASFQGLGSEFKGVA